MAAVTKRSALLPSILSPEFELEDSAIRGLMNVLYEKSSREEGHSRRVSQLCIAIGTELGFSQEQNVELGKIGLLHDIGKISIPSEILNKSMPLLPWEWKEIHDHPVNGHRFLSAIVGMEDVAEATLAHHERMDGSGYPYGLRGQRIPLMARVVAVADAYDAMVSARPYRHAFTHDEAVRELMDGAGSLFDTQITQVFLELLCRETA